MIASFLYDYGYIGICIKIINNIIYIYYLKATYIEQIEMDTQELNQNSFTEATETVQNDSKSIFFIKNE